MPHLEEHIAQKKVIYERYLEGFKGLPVSMNPFDANTMEPNYWLSCMVVDGDYMTEQKRGDTQTSYRIETGKTCPDEILDALLSINAQGRPVWKPMHMQPLYENSPFVTASGLMDKTAADTSVGADIFQRGLCLPSDNKMTVQEQEKIIQQIRNCFN
jgi:dTDP-4-amino-4,6-dideoxygalactose transaminase